MNEREQRWSSHDPADDQPVDLHQVNRDDAFLDSLSRDVPTPTHDDTEYELAELLSGWRHELLAPAAPALPDVDEVSAAMVSAAGTGKSRGLGRHLRIISGAAAIAIVAAAGVTVLSQDSQPGDPLWGVKRVVFADAASQTQAVHDVRSNLERAEAAIAAGDTQGAEQLIALAESELGPLRDDSTRIEMAQWIERLREDTRPTPLPVPLPEDPPGEPLPTEPLPNPGPETTNPATQPSEPPPSNQTTAPSTPPTSQSSTPPSSSPSPDRRQAPADPGN